MFGLSVSIGEITGKMDNVLSSMDDIDSNSSTSDNTSIQNNYSQVVFINNTGIATYKCLSVKCRNNLNI